TRCPSDLRARVLAALDGEEPSAQRKPELLRFVWPIAQLPEGWPLPVRVATPLLAAAAALALAYVGHGSLGREMEGQSQGAPAVQTASVFDDVVRLHASDLPA